MILLGGCNGSAKPASPQHEPALTPAQIQMLDHLRQRTDELMSVVAVADGPEIRKFFPPRANVHVGQQLQFYLNVPLRRLRIVSWDGGAVFGQPVSRDRAVTALRLMIQHGRDLPHEIPVIFYWQQDPDDGNFYLLPLSQPQPLPTAGPLPWPADSA